MRVLLPALLMLALSGNAFALEQYAALSPLERQPSAFAKAMRLIMSLATPSVSERVRNRLVADYEAARGHKAQAVEPTTSNYWRAILRESPERAVEAALEGCQFRYRSPCAIVAVDDEITDAAKLVVKDMPRLGYKGQFDLKMIPAVRDVTLKRVDIEFYASATEQKAMAFHPSGRVFATAGKATIQDAINQALLACNSERTIDTVSGGVCFVYAINNDVVLNERKTK